jgi:hypothetical protein
LVLIERVRLSRVVGGNGTRDSSDLGKLTGEGRCSFRESGSIVEAAVRSLKTFGARRTGKRQDGLVSQWTGGAEWDASSAEKKLSGTLLKVVYIPMVRR